MVLWHRHIYAAGIIIILIFLNKAKLAFGGIWGKESHFSPLEILLVFLEYSESTLP
jgi:hypothetical protein